ncbi:alpha-protein kinase 1-like [Liolophura sinensis]|uniref:alpha-protein kinase 1-like n=1 Tax=Liolophura sinensis TaxID=3198878 RepID=UPI003157F771
MSRTELIGQLGLSLSQSDTEFLLRIDDEPGPQDWEEAGNAGKWLTTLPRRLQTLVKSAIQQDWPFLPPDIKPDWLTSRNDSHPSVSQNLILLKSLLLALENEKFSLASAVAFVLDRFMYWYGGAKVILNVVSVLAACDQCPAIAPQMLIRKARVLKDSGDLHGAVRVLHAIVASDWNSPAPGSWQYKSKAQHDNVVAVCVQIEGQILHNLGLWPEAIHLLVQSITGFESLPVKDDKGISSSLGILGKCLKQLSMKEYEELRRRYPGLVQPHPCQEAYSKAVSAAQLCPPQNLFTARHWLDAGESLLRFAVQQNQFHMKHQVLDTALSRLNESLAQHQAVKGLQSREQSFEFLKALYLASIALMHSPNGHDTRLAWVLEELSIALYSIYCRNAEGLGKNPEAVRLCNMALQFLNLPTLNGSPGGDELSKTLQELRVNPKHDLVKQHGNLQNTTGEELYISNPDNDGNAADVVKVSVEPEIPKLILGQDDKSKSHDNLVRLAQMREVGLPANPHSPRYTSIDHDLVRAAHQSSETRQDPSDSSLSAKVDPAATTLCSTYTIEALRDLQRGDLSLSSNSGSASASTDSSGCSSRETDTSGYTVPDEVEFSPITQYRPLVDWGDHVPPNASAHSQHGGLTSFSPNTHTNFHQVQQVVEDNYANAVNKMGASRALLWQYDPLQKQWNPQSTLVFIGSLVDIPKHKKGKHRDTIHIQFLHQDESLGRYVAKRYRKENPILEEYLQDVKSQMTARFFVTLFNQRLQSLPNVDRFAKIQYLPAAHLQVLTPSGQIMDYLNVEPYLEGDSEFVKLTNNFDYVNTKVKSEMLETVLAFTHFTYAVSQGQTMIVDLQGWVPRDTSDVLYLTDPQLNSSGDGKASPFDQKERGIEVFWKQVHPHCKQLCLDLHLQRPK